MDKTHFHRSRDSRVIEIVKQLISRRSLSDVLLLIFAVAAMLTVAVAAIGWFSFQEVVSTQRAITTDAIPAADAVQVLARSNIRIATIAPQFGRVENRQEYSRILEILKDHVARMGYLLEELEERQFEPEVRSVLAKIVREIESNIRQQGVLVGERLDLERRERALLNTHRNAGMELVTLSESMVANASTSITSIISGLYSIIDRTDESGSSAYDALDRLIEVDMDNMERMSEFQLICFQLNARIEQLEDTTKTSVVSRIEFLFKANLEVLERRIKDINDPQRRRKADGYYHVLLSATATGGVFDVRRTRFALIDKIARLQQLGNEDASRLNEQANKLLGAASDVIDRAGLEAEQAVNRGVTGFLVVAALLLFALIVTLWVLMRHHIIRRLHGMELAVRAISTGDFDTDISTAGDDELARLGRALDQLRENTRERERLEGELQRNQRNLEWQVEKRTSELKRSNVLLEKEVADHARARSRAEEANQAKTTFLGTMSHELRTPLSGVLGTLQLLSDTGPNERQRECISMIRSANTTLLEILEDMLGYSKLESGKLDIEHSPFVLRESINNILSLQALRAHSKNIALICDIDDDVPNRVLGDRPKLNQIVLNLVGNAVKFTDEGSVTLSIKRYRDVVVGRGVTLIFTVTDTGIGIPESKHRDVFSPFYQVDDTAHRRDGGTGLGLTICKKLVEAMGGTIWVESAPGEGTLVGFRLTYIPALGTADTDTVVLETPLPPIVQPLRVLVVEDDPINRTVCLHYLESLGHQSIQASDGGEALTLLQQQVDPIDAVLMDISLPGFSGVEVAMRIRALPDARWKSVPVIAMSAHVFGDNVESYYASGMADFLSKPFTRDQLSRALYAATSEQVNQESLTLPEEVEVPSVAPVRESLLDTDYIEEELETLGQVLFSELLGLFIQEAGGTFDTLDTLAKAKDWSVLSRHAHRFKSAAGNLGLSLLAQQAQRIEHLTLISPTDSDHIAVEICKLRETCGKSCRVLRKLVSHKGEN
ncbi:MAG: TMAO reductase system sensor histidine kinase/response regulator TorS [Gammaproteobacteria bacterium]|nr:TMAO reductase system sensor histidine kinase/response regulator TorS [Gammaproteobacteria bacterium]